MGKAKNTQAWFEWKLCCGYLYNSRIKANENDGVTFSRDLIKRNSFSIKRAYKEGL